MTGSKLRSRPTAPTARSTPALLALVAAVVLLWAEPASAHVDLVGTDPADGSVQTTPVTELRFEFSGAISSVPEQTFLFDSSGDPLEISDITVVDDTTLVITPAVAMTEGLFGAQWAVRAGDSHPRTGSITFEVAAPAPPSTTAAVPPGDPEQPVNSAPEPVTPTDDELVSALNEAARESDSGAGGLLEALGRFLAYSGTLLAVGTLAFIAWVFEGRRSEIAPLARQCGLGGLLAVCGTVLEAAGLAATLDDNTIAAAFDPGAWSALGDTDAWIGLLLRGFGGAVIAVTAYSARSRLRLSALNVLGAFCLLASGAFIGHTASESPRALAAVSDFVHLAAASVWSGAAVALFLTLRRRTLAGVDAESKLLVSRYSTAATWSVVAVAATGVAMAWVILPGPSDLWSTDFGRILLVKVVLVAIITTLGAYNHFVLVPELRDGAGSRNTSARFQRTLGAEVVLFVAVVVATVALVGASPT